LIKKRLLQAIVLPDMELLEKTEGGIFLKDLDRGNISITNSAELVCQIFSENNRIFYEDTEHLWTELVHDNGVFLRFAPITDHDIMQYIELHFLTV
jgi:hypothetical protein